jgi:ribosome-associated protein
MIWDRWRRRPASEEEQPEVIWPQVVPVREDVIRLGQFLKLADMIDNGSDAKPLLAEGLVQVNGEVETRRGRQLVKGDVVTVDDRSAQVG